MTSVAQSLEIALSLHQSGQLSQAAELYRQILAAEPRHATALHLLGVSEHQAGRHTAAIDLIARAIQQDGGQALFHNNLGEAYRAVGRPIDAEACYRRAIQLAPNLPLAHYNLGLLMQSLGRQPDAERAFEIAVTLNPNYPEAQYALGNARLARQDAAQAAAAYRAALACRKEFFEAHNGLGVALQSLGQLAEAAACFERAVQIAPRSYEAQANLALALQLQGRIGEAQQAFERAVALSPESADAHFHLAECLQVQGKYDQAILEYQRAIALEPEHAEAHYFLSTVRLARGQFAAAWPDFEWRLRTKFAGRNYQQPRWDGADLRGQQILVYAEGGLGDTLQFMRYVPQVQGRGGDVRLAVQGPLVALVKQAGFANVMALGDAVVDTCRWRVPMLSLPAIFDTTLDSIPAPVPYLNAKPELVEFWRSRLQSLPGYKIGIAWQGSKTWWSDMRSIALAEFAPLAGVSGVTLVSLQKSTGVDQLEAVRDRFQVVDYGDEVDVANGPFMDTAAIIENLDLVITCDTATAHLAGALGARMWVALVTAPEWRWLEDRCDSPWYPTARLFRQTRLGVWRDVFQRMTQELTAVVAGRNSE